MKNILFIWIILLSVSSVVAQNDSTATKKYTLGGVPILSFDADIGFRYGAVFNLSRYDKDSSSHFQENYSENLFIRSFNSTKGSFQIQSLYESDHILPRGKTFIEATYVNDKSYDFFGFNGQESKYTSSFTNPSHTTYQHGNFYSNDRSHLRIRFDFQWNTKSNHLRLLTGLTYNSIRYTYTKNETSLLQKYNEMGFIDSSELTGGTIPYFTIGLIYEKRNNQFNCMKGDWHEAYFVFAPPKLGSAAFSKFIVTFRKYLPTPIKKTTLMIRTSLQRKLTGKIPFYMLSTYFDSRLNQDGLGGAFNLRGIQRNRILSDGFIVTNLELRYNFFQKTLFRKELIVSISSFIDNAMINQRHPISLNNLDLSLYKTYFNQTPKLIYTTVGTGLYFVINQNSIININYGIPLSYNETKGGLYIGSSFLF